MTLNLRSDEGRNVFLKLAHAADVVLESNRPGVADRNGVGYQSVRAGNPRIVYCALSGYGASGPEQHRPGYDLIFAAQCGMLAALTGKHARPLPPGTYLADGVSGLTAAYAIAVALLAREREGRGSYVDLAMHDSLFALLAVSHGVRRPGERPAPPAYTPTYAVYPAAAGTWLALGAIRPASARALLRIWAYRTSASRTPT
jgi:CoA:oxalate CoA-transferase